MKFEWHKFLNRNNKIAVHCKTQREADDFLKKMDAHGLTWSTGDSYLYLSNWNSYFNDTVYTNLGTFGSTRCLSEYEILEWSDYMNSEFTKRDLRNGDVVVFEYGETAIAIPDMNVFIFEDGYIGVIGDDEDSFMKVYRPLSPGQCSFDERDYTDGKLIYEYHSEDEVSEEEDSVSENSSKIDELVELFRTFLKGIEAEERARYAVEATKEK